MAGSDVKRGTCLEKTSGYQTRVFEAFLQGVFEGLSALRFPDYHATEPTGGAVFECQKRGKLMISGGFPLEDKLLLILMIENKKDKCIPAFVIQIG